MIIITLVNGELAGIVDDAQIQCCGITHMIPQLPTNSDEAQKFILQFKKEAERTQHINLSPVKPYLEAILQKYGLTHEDALRLIKEYNAGLN